MRNRTAEIHGRRRLIHKGGINLAGVNQGSVLYTADEIDRRVRELGREISSEYKGRDLILVGILKGSLIFLADLLRNIEIPVDLDFMCVETYKNRKTPSETSKILYSGGGGFSGRNLLVVEDIIDTGLTIRYIKEALEKESPNTLEICTLLEKEHPRKADTNIKYVGFRVPQVFVIGYGMDYRGEYRGLPYIGVLNQENKSEG